jgi:hypothetical protein
MLLRTQAADAAGLAARLESTLLGALKTTWMPVRPTTSSAA